VEEKRRDKSSSKLQKKTQDFGAGNHEANRPPCVDSKGERRWVTCLLRPNRQERGILTVSGMERESQTRKEEKPNRRKEWTKRSSLRKDSLKRGEATILTTDCQKIEESERKKILAKKGRNFRNSE